MERELYLRLIGKHGKLTLYYEGSRHLICNTYEGTLLLENDKIVFVGDDGRRTTEDSFEHYDVALFEPGSEVLNETNT